MKHIELKIFNHIHEDYVPSVKSTSFQDMPESCGWDMPKTGTLVFDAVD